MADVSILLDSFPSITYTPEGARYEPSRTVVYDGKVEVWVTPSGMRQPEVAYTRPVLSVSGNRIAGFEVLTADGVVLVRRAGGCGCGNALKNFDVYNGATRRILRLEEQRG